MSKLVALVTGGTGALGSAVASRLAESGMTVHATSRSGGASRKGITLHEVDLTDAGSVDVLFAALEPGGLDVLCNVAGGFALSPIDETAPETWRRMMDMNATTAFLCARRAVPLLRKRGRGRIVNVASGPALDRGAANMSAYAAAKAAVLNLTYSLAKELVGDGITVNALVPSIIDTEDNRKAMPDADTSNWLRAEEIAEVVLWLASAEAAIVTGTAVNLTRG